MTLEQLNQVLHLMIQQGGSDLHLKSGDGIRARIRGKIVPLVANVTLKKEHLLSLLKEMLKERFNQFLEEKDMDFSYRLDEKYRFRVNAFWQLEGPSIVMRVIPVKILSIKELGLPQAVYKFVEMERGLVLVTGVTGSGKSTTLAAIINEINETKEKHIITIEDPIEFIHKDKKSLINQRGVGEHTKSFARALKSALREDPDVILVGEMRDIETIEIALHAAETGHLVFSTLHTLDAKETINRIIGVFPPEEQNRIRLVLASVLQGVISQRLVPTLDNKRVAAMEILLSTARIRDLIAEGRDEEIRDALEEGKKIYGTQTFDQHLIDLVLNKKISEEMALEFATNKDDLKLKLKQELLKGDSSYKPSAIGLKED